MSQPAIDAVETAICEHLKDGRQLKKLRTAQLNDSASEVQTSNETSKELKSSLSNMSNGFVGRVLRVDINQLNAKGTICPEDLIDLRADDLTELNEAVFDEMNSMVSETVFPKGNVSVAMRQQFVIMMIRKIVQFVRRKHDLHDDKLKWSVQTDKFKFKFLEVEKDIIPDIILYGLADSTTADAISEDAEPRLKTYCVVVGCKKDNLEDGVKRALVYLRKIYELNDDAKPVYGFSTDSINFEFLSYDGRRFRLCTNLNFLFPGMFERRQRWLDEFTKILRVFYSVLCKRLDLRSKTCQETERQIGGCRLESK